jgi:hypothetical protein
MTMTAEMIMMLMGTARSTSRAKESPERDERVEERRGDGDREGPERVCSDVGEGKSGGGGGVVGEGGGVTEEG